MAFIRTLFFSKKNDPRISFMLRTCGLHLQDSTKKLTIDYSSAEDPTKWKTGKIWKEYMNVKVPTKIGSLFEEHWLISNKQWRSMKKEWSSPVFWFASRPLDRSALDLKKQNERNGVCKNVSTQFLKFCPSILVFPVTKPSAKSELKTCLQVRKHPQTVLPFAMKIKWVEHNKNTIQLSITSIPKFMNQIFVQWRFALIHALPLPFVDLRPIQRLHRGGRRIWMQRSLNAWFFRKNTFLVVTYPENSRGSAHQWPQTNKVNQLNL